MKGVTVCSKHISFIRRDAYFIGEQFHLGAVYLNNIHLESAESCNVFEMSHGKLQMKEMRT
jgi:hypothetical protein